MLVTHDTPSTLTVQIISAHLGVGEWVVGQELKSTRPGRLKGVKLKGAGRVGQGGQWQVEVDDYLDWLGVPAEDREHPGPDGLPQLYPFEVAAERVGVSTDRLVELLNQHRLPYLRVGRQRYLTDSQFTAARKQLRKDTRN